MVRANNADRQKTKKNFSCILFQLMSSKQSKNWAGFGSLGRKVIYLFLILPTHITILPTLSPSLSVSLALSLSLSLSVSANTHTLYFSPYFLSLPHWIFFWIFSALLSISFSFAYYFNLYSLSLFLSLLWSKTWWARFNQGHQTKPTSVVKPSIQATWLKD